MRVASIIFSLNVFTIEMRFGLAFLKILRLSVCVGCNFHISEMFLSQITHNARINAVNNTVSHFESFAEAYVPSAAWQAHFPHDFLHAIKDNNGVGGAGLLSDTIVHWQVQGTTPDHRECVKNALQKHGVITNIHTVFVC